MSANYEDILAYQALTQRASSAAQAAYSQAQGQNMSEQMALARAQFAWKQELDRAGQTGMWEGQWNNPQEQWFTSQFGQWFGPGGAPTAGQQTLAAQQQQDTSAQNWTNMFGQYYAPGTAPEQGAQTMAGQQQQFQQGISAAGLTGTYNGQQTMQGQQQAFAQELARQQEARAAQAQGQSQTMSYLQLLSSLRGPADYAKYQQVLGTTPNGMRDLAAAAMGQYVPGGGATTGVQPQAVSLQSLMGDVSGNPYYGQGGGQLNQPNVYGGGQGSYYNSGQGMGMGGGVPMAGQRLGVEPWQGGGAQQVQWQAGAGKGDVGGGYNANLAYQHGGYNPAFSAATSSDVASAYGPGGLVPQGQNAYANSGSGWGTGINYGDKNGAMGAAMGGAGAAPGSQDNQMGQLPAPNQISAQSWNAFTPSQKQMMLGQYESGGWNKDDVTALMNQALPKYANNSPTAGTWRMNG